MGNRLSKITTRTGDTGSTGLATGERLSKADARVVAMGEVDELNSVLGVLLALPLPAPVRNALAPCQHELFDLGGELAMPPEQLLAAPAVLRLDHALAALNADLPPLKEFILPGGNEATARAHVARTVARRAERSLWALHAQTPLHAEAPQYLNRLSDLLFVCARVLARADGGELCWQPAQRRT